MGIDQKISVCHLISGDLWAGAEVQMYTVMMALRGCADLELSAIVLNKGTLAEKLREAGIRIEIFDESRLGFFEISRRVQAFLGERDTAIIHSHRYKENILAALVKKKGKTRFLVQTVHGLGEPFRGIKQLRSQVYGLVNTFYTIRYFDRVIAVSDDIHRRLGKHFRPEKILTIHNAIDNEKIAPTRGAELVRSEFGIASDAPVIGSVGRMVPVKGFDLFLAVAKLIVTRRPDVRFLLVGDGPLKPGLESRSRVLGLASNVIFTGFRQDVTDLINCLDIFMMTSYHEGIPMALLEAMALKKAVVSTAVGGIGEVISNGKSGLLAEPGSSTELAQACLRILDDDALKVRLGAVAAQRIDDEFSIGTLTEMVSAIYRNLAGLK